MNDDLKKGNLIVQLTFDFAVAVVGFCASLETGRRWASANQLLRAGLSIGANVKEAQNAESRADFIHKMKIAAKEGDEVEYYLEICRAAPELPDPGSLLEDVMRINRILTKIIASSKRPQERQ